MIEEIIVTAQKRAQSIQDVAASISAINAQDLNGRGIKDLSDIQFAVPGMHFGDLLGEQNITIRGIGSFARQPGVSVSIDGVYQSRSSTAQLYQLDLERIEILRGPQGTLYGRNSNGGVVNYVTNSPSQEAEGFLRVGYAEYDETKIEGVYSGPLSDRVGFRIAVDQLDRGEGWIENKIPGMDSLMKGQYSNVRLKLSVEATETLSLDFMAALGRSEGPQEHMSWITDNRELATGVPQLATANISLEPLTVYADARSDANRDYDLFSVTASWDLGWATLKSISAYQEFLDDFDSDRDGTDLPIFAASDISNIETFTQEFNLTGSNANFDWVLGAYFLDEDWNRRAFFDNALPVLGFPVASQWDFNQYKYDTDSSALFFDGTWNVTDRARISAGIRYTQDEISEAHINDFIVLTPDPVLALRSCDQAIETDWSETTVRLVGQYDITDSSNIYVAYSQGYKAGGVAPFECTQAYKPETVDSYEAAYKATYSGGRTILNAALFAYDYSNFQVNQIVGISTVTANANAAKVRGAELEISSLLNENWQLSAGFTLLNAEYGNFVNFDALQPELGFQNVKGNSLNRSPKTSINLGVSYTTESPWGGSLIMRADGAYRSRVFFREFNQPEDSQAGYTVFNLNTTWESDDRSWQVRLFAKNASDEQYIVSLLGSATNGGRLGTWGMPRQIGFELTRRM